MDDFGRSKVGGEASIDGTIIPLVAGTLNKDQLCTQAIFLVDYVLYSIRISYCQNLPLPTPKPTVQQPL